MLFMTSCNMDGIELSENIDAPKNNNLPISGEWRIEDYKINATSGMDEEKAKSYLGTEALFHNDLISLGENYCTDPSFRIKNVDTEEYLIYHYKVTPEFLNIDSNTMEVVSITGTEQFFYEFLKVSNNTVIVNIEGVFFYLNKVSEDPEVEGVEHEKLTENILLDTARTFNEESLSTAILLGLKSLDLENNEEGIEKWNYRTLFIRSENKEIISIYEMKDILLPRKTGFWKVNVEREQKDDKINDNILAYPLNKTLEKGTEVKDKEDENKESTIKNILYIGNDYISLENIHYRNKGERVLEFYPVDNIGKFKPLMISDVIGEIGKEAFIEGVNKEILADKEEYKNSSIDLRPNEESFGLFRRNGHWVFNGRINYVDNGISIYENFNIKAIPPKEVVYYDELSIPWNRIKSKVPEALDAFTSPNEDIGIVITHNDIFIYTIEDGEFSNKPVKSIRLNSTEKIIMAEWAVGRYPKLWEEEFLKHAGN